MLTDWKISRENIKIFVKLNLYWKVLLSFIISFLIYLPRVANLCELLATTIVYNCIS